MRILYLSSEVFPFFKTGGLADVMDALPKAIAKKGHKVSVMMPKYDMIPLKYLQQVEYVDSVDCNYERFNLVKLHMDDIDYYFVENRNYFERGHAYGDFDQDVQYVTFSEVALMFLKKINLEIDILHCNDWQTGAVPYFLNVRYRNDPFYKYIKSVYTIHNLMYQGRFNNYSFNRLGYEFHDDINLMSIGINSADIVNTVSETYAEEIKSPTFSEGLEWSTNNNKIYGIVNGINTDFYNPETTADIFNYSIDDIANKQKNKYVIQEEFGLPISDNILISLVTRLVEGKGLDLVSAKLEELLSKDAIQIILLGSGDKYYEDYYEYLTRKYPDKFRIYLGYNEKLANKVYAGSDLFLMPSRYEPCGLSQMIAMRYGTIPLVRETGGLKDTVKPYNVINNEGNGFTFTYFNADDMLYTIRYAEHFYYDRPDIWEELVIKNMKIDVSWENSANKYLELYKQ